MKVFWFLSGLLGTALLIAACDTGGKEAQTPPSVSPTPTPIVTSSATPTATSTALNIRFVPAELPIFTGDESADPMAAYTSPSEWKVYIVRGDGPPQLAYETHRYVQRLQWSVDGSTLIAPFRSEATTLPRSPRTTGPFGLDGAIFLDTGGPEVSSSDIVMDGPVAIIPSSDGFPVAWNLQGGERPWQVYTTDRHGRASKLEGLGDGLIFVDWVPDGSGLLVQATGGVYLVRLDGGPATLVNPGPIHAGASSLDGSRFAFVYGAYVYGPEPPRGDLYVFDGSTSESRQITSEGKYYVFGPPPQWSADGKEVIIGGALIDVATGNELTSLPPDFGGALSPNGRYFLAASGSETCGGSMTEAKNRIYLWDRQTGESRLLIDCQAFYDRPQWLADGHHVLLLTPQGFGSPIVYWSVTLVDVQSGETELLTDGLEPHGAGYRSPDGSRILVTGKELRLYTSDGQLLREFTVPEGFDVARAAWSPDGSSFTYVVGPEGFELI